MSKLKGGTTIGGYVAAHAGNLADLSRGTVLYKKTLALPTWNMDTVASVTVNHGLILSQIRSISALIITDLATVVYDFNAVSTASTSTQSMWFNDTYVQLTRATTGFFDSGSFASTAASRGWLVIEYEL